MPAASRSCAAATLAPLGLPPVRAAVRVVRDVHRSRLGTRGSVLLSSRFDERAVSDASLRSTTHCGRRRRGTTRAPMTVDVHAGDREREREPGGRRPRCRAARRRLAGAAARRRRSDRPARVRRSRWPNTPSGVAPPAAIHRAPRSSAAPPCPRVRSERSTETSAPRRRRRAASVARSAPRSDSSPVASARRRRGRRVAGRTSRPPARASSPPSPR